MKRFIRNIALSFALIVLFGNFQDPGEPESRPIQLTPLMQEELESRIQNFRKEQWAACRRRALEAASRQVDSLIIDWAKANRDTFGRPPRPEKPLPPEPLLPKDSTPVRPLFNGGQSPPADTTF